MKKLVESQSDENQVNQNELEELYGGSGCTIDITCGKFLSASDEDGGEDIVF